MSRIFLIRHISNDESNPPDSKPPIGTSETRWSSIHSLKMSSNFPKNYFLLDLRIYFYQILNFQYFEILLLLLNSRKVPGSKLCTFEKNEPLP